MWHLGTQQAQWGWAEVGLHDPYESLPIWNNLTISEVFLGYPVLGAELRAAHLGAGHPLHTKSAYLGHQQEGDAAMRGGQPSLFSAPLPTATHGTDAPNKPRCSIFLPQKVPAAS